ncbi:hypothetical protein D9M70_445470 [compost metagenome]
MGFLNVLCIGRDRQHVEPHLRALRRDRIVDGHAGLRFGCTVAGLEDVAGETDRKADVAVGERVDVFRRMELAHVGTDACQEFGRLFQIGSIVAIRIEAEIGKRRRHDVGRGIEDVDAAILELRRQFRLEDHVPVGLLVRAQDRLHLVDVVADAGGAPHVVDGVFVARIVLRRTLHDHVPHIGKVRQLRLVELLEHAGGDLPLQEGCRRHDHVVTRTAREQLRLQDLVGIEDVIDDLDTGLLGEVFQNAAVDVIRPVVDVDHALLRRGQHGRTGQYGCRQGCDDELGHTTPLLIFRIGPGMPGHRPIRFAQAGG